MKFFTKNPNLKKKGVLVGGSGSWSERQSGLNQFGPSTSSKLGA